LKNEFVTHSDEETRGLGQELGKRLKPGTVIGLSGTLGAGKTRFTQGIGSGLEIPENSIASPTFTLCVPYRGRLQLLHLDAYRISHASEIDELGLDEWVEDGAVLVVEWYERFSTFFPPLDIQVTFQLIDDSTRKIFIETLSLKGTIE
jgi:tRNA threonylcarbamoyladenosine biosynthesis protein TsaE